MNEIKGLITLDRENDHHLTCCDHRPNVKIDGACLKDLLQKLSGLNGPHSQEDRVGDDHPEQKEVMWAVRYVIRDEPWKEGDSFEGAVLDILYSDEVRGCYSEWTCGVGDFDFVLKGSGHSILVELASHGGKHVWLKLTEP